MEQSFLFFLHPVLMKDRCKLFCRVAGTTAYYQLKDRVIDGTACGPDTFDICVQGLCRVYLSVVSFAILSCMKFEFLSDVFGSQSALISSHHLLRSSKRAATTSLTPRPGMTSAACVAGTTPRAKPWRGPSMMLSMVSPTPHITSY